MKIRIISITNVTNGSLTCIAQNCFFFPAVSKDIKEGTGKFLKNALYIQWYGKRLKCHQNISLVIVELQLYASISQEVTTFIVKCRPFVSK